MHMTKNAMNCSQNYGFTALLKLENTKLGYIFKMNAGVGNKIAKTAATDPQKQQVVSTDRTGS